LTRNRWKKIEVNALVILYPDFTIKELMQVFKGKTEESINTKISRLKKEGLIARNKESETRTRAMVQRRKRVLFQTSWPKEWNEPETNALKALYKDFTTKELCVIFAAPTLKRITDKIMALKRSGEMPGNRKPETMNRSMRQRRWVRQEKPGVFNVDPDSWMDEQ